MYTRYHTIYNGSNSNSDGQTDPGGSSTDSESYGGMYPVDIITIMNQNMGIITATLCLVLFQLVITMTLYNRVKLGPQKTNRPAAKHLPDDDEIPVTSTTNPMGTGPFNGDSRTSGSASSASADGSGSGSGSGSGKKTLTKVNKNSPGRDRDQGSSFQQPNIPFEL